MDFYRKNKKILLISCLIIFISCIGILIKLFIIDPYFSEKNVKDAHEIYYNELPNKESDIKTIEKLKPLIESNPDIKGWLKIENTPIDYPVVQPNKNEPDFYLNRNHLKQKDANGSIFINPFMTFSSEIQNIVLHGHSMKNGKMFAFLLKLRNNISSHKNSLIIDFDSIYGAGKFKVFAIFSVNTLEKHGKIFNYLVPKFNSANEFFELVYQMKIRSVIDTAVDIAANDKILTLSTCSYEMEKFRTVVAARKIRPAESEKINQNNMKIISDPLMPEAWYKVRKRTMPKFCSFEEALNSGKIDWIKK
jgi:sortase B